MMVKRTLVYLILLSYCCTIPVLSIVHWHQFGTGTHASLFTSSGNGRASEGHPIFCGLCARITSSLSFVTTSTVFPTIHPLYEISYRCCETNFISARHTPCLDRAPPSVHTAS